MIRKPYRIRLLFVVCLLYQFRISYMRINYIYICNVLCNLLCYMIIHFIMLIINTLTFF